MMIKIVFLMFCLGIGVVNYYFSKAFWLHEGSWGKDVPEQ